MEQMLENQRKQDTEHKAWIEMFNKFCEVLEITNEEGNQDKYRNFFCLVETWGQDLARMRIYQKENNIFDITQKDGRVLKPIKE